MLGFSRKKPAPDTAAPPTASSSKSPDDHLLDEINDTKNLPETTAFDLDSFAAQFEPGSEANSNLNSDSDTGSAFDFPEPNATSNASPAAPNFDDLFAPPKPVPAPVSVQMDEVTAAPAAIPILPTPSNKKKIPLLPVLGTVAVIVLAGAAFSMRGGPSDDMEAPAPVAPPKPPVALAPGAPPSAPQNAAPENAPTSPSDLPSKAQIAAPEAPQAPSTTEAAKVEVPKDDPVLAAQLKALWKQGAEAKHRGDLVTARRVWELGLSLQPENRGFQQSLAKLPRTAKQPE